MWPIRKPWSSQHVLHQSWDTPQRSLRSQQLLMPPKEKHSHTCLLPQTPAYPNQRGIKRIDTTVSPLFEHGRSTMDQRPLLVARESPEVSLLSKKGYSYSMSSFLLSLTPPPPTPKNGTTEWCLFPTKDFPNET